MKKIKIDWSDFILEVISIFLGVTVAILVNNWSENKKMEKQESVILQGIYNDIENEIKELSIILNSINRRDSMDKVYMGGIINKSLSNHEIRTYIMGISFFKTYQASHTTLETLKASNNISSITDHELLKNIIRHYSYENQLKKKDERYENTVEENYDKYIIEKVDVRDFVKPQKGLNDYVALLDDIKFTNILLALSKFNRDRQQIYTYFLNEKQRLLKELETRKT